MNDSAGKPTVAVVGGGLSGLAASVALCRRGLDVELFEARKQLGGRAGSFRDAKADQSLDHCQHVAMGCCTNLADFCRRTRIADCFGRHRELHFFSPDGSQHDFIPSRWLPAPLHLASALMRLRYLSVGERLAVIHTLRRLARESDRMAEEEGPIGPWLRRHGQSDRAIERFWSPVLIGALSESLDRASLSAARKVFVDGFLASRGAYELEIPNVPLGEMYHRRMAAWLSEQGVKVHLGARVRQIDGDADRATALQLSDGTRREFDFLIVAVPWHRVRSLFPQAMLKAMPALEGVKNIHSAPITAVHLWFDRPITPLPHAVLLGKLSQWLFNGGQHVSMGHYCQVVISASHELAARSREDVVDEVRRDIEAIWPGTHKARRLHYRVITHRAAVFSVTPGIDRFRVAQRTPIANLLLAGDWTATGWPATMEGAVRSGYLAAEDILQQLGIDERVLVPDLPKNWLARRLFGN